MAGLFSRWDHIDMSSNDILALLKLAVNKDLPPIEVKKVNREEADRVPPEQILAEIKITVEKGIQFQLVPEPQDQSGDAPE